jgi:hypothetical protein
MRAWRCVSDTRRRPFLHKHVDGFVRVRGGATLGRAATPVDPLLPVEPLVFLGRVSERTGRSTPSIEGRSLSQSNILRWVAW